MFERGCFSAALGNRVMDVQGLDDRVVGQPYQPGARGTVEGGRTGVRRYAYRYIGVDMCTVFWTRDLSFTG